MSQLVDGLREVAWPGPDVWSNVVVGEVISVGQGEVPALQLAPPTNVLGRPAAHSRKASVGIARGRGGEQPECFLDDHGMRVRAEVSQCGNRLGGALSEGFDPALDA